MIALDEYLSPTNNGCLLSFFFIFCSIGTYQTAFPALSAQTPARARQWIVLRGKTQRSSPPSEFLYSQPVSQPSLTRRANDSFDDSEMIRLHCMICAGGEEITAPAAAHPSRAARPRSATASQQVAALSQCACSLTKITSSCLSFVLPSFMSSVLEAMHSLNAL